MLSSLPRTGTELMVRVVRDNLADCLVTVPELVKDGRSKLIHGYFGTHSPMRRKMFPALEAAYDSWRAGGDIDELREVAETGAKHWTRVATDLISLFSTGGDPLPLLDARLREATL